MAEHGARLSALLNTLPDLVWLKDPNGVYLACNPRVEQLYGTPEANIIGKTDHDFVPHDLADFFRENDLAAIAADSPRINEEWLTFASDGHRELVETIKTPVYDDKGTLLGVLGIARYISARQRTEMAPFPAVLSRVRDGVLLYGNHRAELQYGIRREAGIGQNADTFYEDPAERERFVARMSTVPVGGMHRDPYPMR